MRYLRIKNWEQLQHYKDRSPPWIKLHRDLLTDYEFGQLPDDTKGHLLMLWLLASQMDGRIPDDQKWIAARIGATKPVNLEVLIAKGWLVREQDASSVLAERKQSAMPETETETETEAEADIAQKKARGQLETPTDEHQRIAVERGIDCKTEFAKYRDWQASTGKRHKDEVAGFRNWLRNARVDAGGEIAARRLQAARNIDILTGKASDGRRTFDGVASRVGEATVFALPGGLRESRADDVEGREPPGSASALGG